ncbi:MAG TPA: aminoglycoside phosphotransferase family protein [Candidatus Saccharimonadales bacterium]
MSEPDQEPIKGGVNELVKIGSTIHRPAGTWTKQVHELLSYIRSRNFTAAPEPLGYDENGLEILSFLEGNIGAYPITEEARTDEALVSSAKLLRQYHDSTVGFAAKHMDGWQHPARQPVEVICHGDYGPHNCLFEHGQAVGIIDFDTAHPGPRVWDVAYAVYRFAPLTQGEVPKGLDDIKNQAKRMRLFCDGYGITEADRSKLIDVVRNRLKALVESMKEQAAAGNLGFQEHIRRGDADLYLKDVAYIDRHREHLVKVLN